MTDWLRTLGAFGNGFVDARRESEARNENKRRYDEQTALRKEQQDYERTQKDFDSGMAFLTNPLVSPEMKRAIARMNPAWAMLYKSLETDPTHGAIPNPAESNPAPTPSAQFPMAPPVQSQQPQVGYDRAKLQLTPEQTKGLMFPVDPNPPTPQAVAALRMQGQPQGDIFDRQANYETPAMKKARLDAEARQAKSDSEIAARNKLGYLQGYRYYSGDPATAKAYGELAPEFGYEKGLNIFSPLQAAKAQADTDYRDAMADAVPVKLAQAWESLELKKQTAETDAEYKDALIKQRQIDSKIREKGINLNHADAIARVQATLSGQANTANIAAANRDQRAEQFGQKQEQFYSGLAVKAGTESTKAQKGTWDPNLNDGKGGYKPNPTRAQQFYDVETEAKRRAGMKGKASAVQTPAAADPDTAFLQKILSTNAPNYPPALKANIKKARAAGVSAAQIAAFVRAKGVR